MMFRNRIGAVLLALAIVLLGQFATAGSARAWWNGDWPYRQKLSADLGPKGANINQPVGNTQILVRLHSGNFNFNTIKDDGADLRFVAADDKTPLHFHIARFDSLVDQVALVWVDVPDLAPGAATTMYMYWGNKNATAGGDPHETYDSDQVLVYHFGDENGLPKDSTANGINALTGGKRDGAGITGFALKLDGTQPVQLPQAGPLAIAAGGAGTWSTWFRYDDPANSFALFSQRDAANGLTIGVDHGVVYAEANVAGAVTRTTAGKPVTGGTWHLAAVTSDGTKLTVYVDGAPAGDAAVVLPAIAGQALIAGAGAIAGAPAAAPTAAPVATPVPTDIAGVAPPTPATAPTAAAAAEQAAAAPAAAVANFAGLLDEFEISRVARPAGALALAYNDQGPSATLLTFDKPEEASALGNGFLAIILKSITPDAWVVIGILAVLLVLSWIVMVGKQLYIGTLGRANRVFLVDFNKIVGADESGGLIAISDMKRPILRRSPLFRIYRVGAHEMAERVRKGRLIAGEPVPSQSLTAIKTALDTVYFRESRRLNNLMVVLTIAIAGGPFIGLLGTVIGVMITFAAIAAAGDVNVNAIAPGISAALLATVAGLTVAIPALFGYNYFTIRIRDISVEMQVFIEELIARIGEGGNPSHMAARGQMVDPALHLPVTDFGGKSTAMSPALGE